MSEHLTREEMLNEKLEVACRKLDLLERERDELRAEVERLKADRARLDWLDGRGSTYNWSYIERDGKTVYLCRNTTRIQFMTARNAIDAAMKGDK